MLLHCSYWLFNKMKMCDFVKSCCAFAANRTIEIHICQLCKRQIVFVRGAQYKCPICWKVFDDGHTLAIHYHHFEQLQCEPEGVFWDESFIYDGHKEKEPQGCVSERRASTS